MNIVDKFIFGFVIYAVELLVYNFFTKFQLRLRSALAAVQSDRILSCSHEES